MDKQAILIRPHGKNKKSGTIEMGCPQDEQCTAQAAILWAKQLDNEGNLE